MKKGDLNLSWYEEKKGIFSVDSFIEDIDEKFAKVREIGVIPEDEVLQAVAFYMEGHGIDKFECQGLTLKLEGKVEE